MRTAGALILLYGITISRLSRLTTDDITITGDGVSLSLGRHQLRLAEPAATLLHAQLDTVTTVTRDAIAAKWLFPGRQPGRHVAALYHKLARHGLPHAAHGRAAALINLAADLPAPVLSDLLGISTDTAENWAKHASSDWAAYLAARTPPR